MGLSGYKDQGVWSRNNWLLCSSLHFFSKLYELVCFLVPSHKFLDVLVILRRQECDGIRPLSLLRERVTRRRGILFLLCHCLWSFCPGPNAP
jgi:hypothetical protein